MRLSSIASDCSPRTRRGLARIAVRGDPALRVVVERGRDAVPCLRRPRPRAGGERRRDRVAAGRVPDARELLLAVAAGTAARGHQGRAADHARERGRGEGQATTTQAAIAAQRGGQLRHRREAAVGLGVERAREHVEQPSRYLGALRWRSRRPTLGRGQAPHVGDERALAVERLPQRDREGVLVRGGADLGAGMLLGGHVRRRADDVALRGQRRQLDVDEIVVALDAGGVLAAGGDRREAAAGDAEVTDARAPVRAHEHVGGLEVAVHDAGGMDRAEALRQRDEDLDDLAPADVAAPQPPLQVDALDQLHRDVDLILVGIDLVDRDHVGVRQPCERPRLRDQPRTGALVAGAAGFTAVGADELDRDGALEPGVEAPQHDTHRAFAEAIEHEVATDACRGGGLGGAARRALLRLCAGELLLGHGAAPW
ncbi:MAG: hypothetical protein U0168_00060 [Nannocystaceae bacterium]